MSRELQGNLQSEAANSFCPDLLSALFDLNPVQAIALKWMAWILLVHTHIPIYLECVEYDRNCKTHKRTDESSARHRA